jgi:transcriptional regulator with XRE-family HTH domain
VSIPVFIFKNLQKDVFMPRYKLIAARKAADLSQEELAEATKVDPKTVSAWETGAQHPQPGLRRRVREALGNNQDQELFKNYPEGQIPPDVADILQSPHFEHSEPAVSSPSEDDNCQQVTTNLQLPATCQEEPTRAILESSDLHPFIIHIPRSVGGFREFMELVRRQFLDVLAKLGWAAPFGNVSLAIISSPTVDPEEYLAQCKVAIDDCREWFSQGKYSRVERALQVHIPTLRRLGTTISPHQETAASLAVEAYILLIRLATVNLQFADRKMYCVNAVQFGVLSGDLNLHAIALEWHGNTYTLCYHEPQRAMVIFNKMLLGCSSDISQLTKSAIYGNLSIAHAQNGNENQARDYMEMAHIAMPSHPELDFSYRCIQFNASSLDHYEGIMCLHLTERFPKGDYARQAYYALEKSTSKHQLNQSTLGRALIKKADAARAMGEMRECVTCLTDGFRIGAEIGSIRCLSEAEGVIGNMPKEWKQETAVQDLQKAITHAIVARR